MTRSEPSLNPRWLRFLGLDPGSARGDLDHALARAKADPRGWLARTPCGLADEYELGASCPRRHQGAQAIRAKVGPEAKADGRLPIAIVSRVQIVMVPEHIDPTAARRLGQAVANVLGSRWIRGALLLMDRCSGAVGGRPFESVLTLVEAALSRLVAYVHRAALSGAYELAAATGASWLRPGPWWASLGSSCPCAPGKNPACSRPAATNATKRARTVQTSCSSGWHPPTEPGSRRS